MTPALSQSQQLAAVTKALSRGDPRAAAAALFDAHLVSEAALALLIKDRAALSVCRDMAAFEARRRLGAPPFEKALCDAALNGKARKASLLIQAGALLENSRSAALALAMRSPCPAARSRVIRELIERGVDPSRPDRAGRLALSEACALPLKEALAAVAPLLAAGADPLACGPWPRALAERLPAAQTYRDKTGSPASVAASRAPAQLLSALLSASREGVCKEFDSYGRTPLHWAAEAGRWDCCVLLIQRGADLSLADASGRSPSALARLVDPARADALLSEAESLDLEASLRAAPERDRASRL